MANLSTKYRPNNFDSVIGQDVTVSILKNQIETNSTCGSYLFCGPSGCGKTTVARIFSNALNNNEGHPIEIDAASNNSVDNVREIIKNAKQRSLDSKYKIFIIDEAHALSNAAWQAFLKLIEEPNPYTKFIFCTTNYEKIPLTIITRVQQFNFNKVSNELIKKRLIEIINSEADELFEHRDRASLGDPPDYTFTDDSLDYIVSLSNNGVRQAISNLDKCLSYSTVLDMDVVTAALGLGNYDLISSFLNGIFHNDSKVALEILNNLYSSGTDPKQFIYNTLIFLIDLNKSIIVPEISSIPSTEQVKSLFNFSNQFKSVMIRFSELYEAIKYENNPMPVIEVFILSL